MMKVLGLFEQVLNKVLKDSDNAWMKLNLDLELKNIQDKKCNNNK